MTTLPEAAARVRTALEELASALVSFNPEPVLRAEETLGAAVTALARARRDSAGDPDALRDTVRGIREALARCQALGRSAEAVTRLMLQGAAYRPDRCDQDRRSLQSASRVGDLAVAGLLDSLSSASRSLSAARLGLDVAGQNLANVNTEGYSRRAVVLAEVPPETRLSAGRGVTVLEVAAHRDELILARLWNEQQRSAFDAAVLDSLTGIEAAVGLPGESLDADLAAFFDAFRTLADDPTSATGRDAVVRQGQQLTRSFHALSDRLVEARREADRALGTAVDSLNQLAAQVAELNRQISDSGGEVEALRDRRDLAIARLSELAAVTVTRRSDGAVDLTIGSGRPLVIGHLAYTVAAESTPPLGLSVLTTGGFDITSEVEGGRLGGLLQLRDTTLPGYQTELDDLAFSVVSAVNPVHQGGFDATGAAAGDFFVPIATAAGAAAAFELDAALAADSRLVAASGTGAVGDNQTARALAALRDGPIASGGTATPAEAWGRFAYRIGADLGTARSNGEARAAIVMQLEGLRAQVSGVSIDEEAANLVRFQRAYEANARYFTTIVDLLDSLMNMVR